MRIPQTPPDYLQVLADRLGDTEKVATLLRVKATDDQDRYLHWDDFRFRPQPGGLPVVEAWAGTKMARRAQSAAIPLQAKDGADFRFMETDTMRRQMLWLDSNASGHLFMPAELNDKAIGRSFRVATLIEEAFSSSALEGAATTRDIARQMVRDGRAPATKSERMVLNNYRAMEFVRQHQETPLSPDLITEIHRIVTDGTLDRPAMAGVIRGAADHVVVEDDEGNLLHEPPAAATLPARLARLCDFANRNFTALDSAGDQAGDQAGARKLPFIHPIIQAITLHFMIGYDHPFIDGNGRTARALFYWLMLRHGYWLMEFTSISRTLMQAPKRYGKAYLEVETDGNDLTYFCIHQLEVMRAAVDALQQHLRQKAEEKKALEERLLRTGFDHELNSRQLDLLKRLFEQPDVVLTIQEHQRHYGSSYQTARNDLLELEEKGLLLRRKRGKAFAFTPPRDLRHRLEGRRGEGRPAKGLE